MNPRLQHALTTLLYVYHTYFGPSFRWWEFCKVIPFAYGIGFGLGQKTLHLHGSAPHIIGLVIAIVGGLCYIRNPKELPWADLSATAPAVTPPISPQGEGTADETPADQTGEQSDGSASS